MKTNDLWLCAINNSILITNKRFVEYLHIGFCKILSLEYYQSFDNKLFINELVMYMQICLYCIY